MDKKTLNIICGLLASSVVHHCACAGGYAAGGDPYGRGAYGQPVPGQSIVNPYGYAAGGDFFDGGGAYGQPGQSIADPYFSNWGPNKLGPDSGVNGYVQDAGFFKRNVQGQSVPGVYGASYVPGDESLSEGYDSESTEGW
jgi:hypothetical protein